MTVSSSTNKIIGSGNGATTAWPFGFPVLDAAHLQAIYTDATGNETVLDPSLYSVTLNADQTLNPGGSVSYAPAIASGTRLTILRVVPYTQETDIKNQGGFFPEVLERMGDLLAMQIQQIKEQLARAFKLSPSQSAIGELEATDANRANTFLGFGPSGLLTLFSGLASSAVSLAMQPVIAAVSLATARTAMGVPGLGANTFTGAQTLPGNAANALEAVPKQQVDAGDAAVTAALLAGDRQAIWGLTYQNSGGDATNDIDFAAGGCMSDDGVMWLSIAATTKQLDVAAAADNGATPSGMLGPAASLGNNDYLTYLIGNPTTGECRVFAEKADMAPALPTGFTKKRTFGWLKRSAGTIVAFKTYQIGGGGLDYRWQAPTVDVTLLNAVTTTRGASAVKVPLTFSVEALLAIEVYDASSGAYTVLCCPDEDDVAPAANAARLGNLSPVPTRVELTERWVRTSATGTVAYRSTLATVDEARISTIGFRMSRR